MKQFNYRGAVQELIRTARAAKQHDIACLCEAAHRGMREQLQSEQHATHEALVRFFALVPHQQ